MGTGRRVVQGLALTLTLGLPGCYVVDPEADMFGRVNGEIDAGSPVPVAEPYTGGIAADEPNAALVARELLREGGNAADAAAALYFALAVTLPSRAGLGARGACLLYDPVTASVQALEFAAVSMPLPTAVQGMAALHKAYGRVDWRRIIAPAERLARFGFPISRVFAADLAQAASSAATSTEPLREGDPLKQPDLAQTLMQLRLHGAKALTTGELGGRLAATAQELGSAFTVAVLAAFAPRWTVPASTAYGDLALHSVPAMGPAANVALGMWSILAADPRYGESAPEDRPRLLAEAKAQSFAHSAADWSADAAQADGETSFVVVDRDGLAVTCGFTMGGIFETRRLARGTGIVLAQPPAARSGLTLLLATKLASVDLVFAAAASGGSSAPGAAAGVAAGVLMMAEPLTESLYRERLGPRGERESRAGPQGRVNAAFCAEGASRDPEGCVFQSDPRGFGAALSG